MGYWRWPNIGLILVSIYLSLNNLGLLTSGPYGWTYHGERMLGATEIEFDSKGDIRSGEFIDARIWSSNAGVYSISADSQGDAFFTLEFDEGEEKEFRLLIPNHLNSPIIVTVSDVKQNSISWNLGKLYR
jgi:hypothetical protein